jgi:hypothetical protein
VKSNSLGVKARCTTGPQRRITRWEHEHLLEAVQERLDANPQAMRVRRETAEHPFGTLKMRMGATHARVPVGDSATLVRDRRLGVRRVSRILLNAADEIERGVERLVVLRIWRDIGLRTGLLAAFGLKVSAQRSLAARVGTRFELLSLRA